MTITVLYNGQGYGSSTFEVGYHEGLYKFEDVAGTSKCVSDAMDISKSPQ